MGCKGCLGFWRMTFGRRWRIGVSFEARCILFHSSDGEDVTISCLNNKCNNDPDKVHSPYLIMVLIRQAIRELRRLRFITNAGGTTGIGGSVSALHTLLLNHMRTIRCTHHISGAYDFCALFLNLASAYMKGRCSQSERSSAKAPSVSCGGLKRPEATQADCSTFRV